MRAKTIESRATRGTRGYALVALIIALMVIAVGMTVAAPNVKTQAQREREIEMLYRGEQMAEAIARYYSGGKIPPAGLVVKTPPPSYGYLTELKKLKDGVTVGGSNQVYFVRASAYIDPMTNDEWEPIRVGDPRLRKFFRAWQQFTGRQIPPIYASYIGGGTTLDTSERPENETDANGTDPDSELNGDPDDEDDDEFDEDDEDFEDEDDGDDDEDDDDEGAYYAPAPGDGIFVNASYQQPLTPNSNTNANTNSRRPGFKDPGFTFGRGSSNRIGPIIGVISKKKGSSVVAYYGIEKYEEMIFIFIPAAPAGLPGQLQQPQQTPGQSGSNINDSNGDGIDDNVKPNEPEQQ